jgi:hypothetical protein
VQAGRCGGVRGDRRELPARQAGFLFEPLADFLQAGLPPLQYAREVRVEGGVRLVDLQPDDVNSLTAPLGGELDAGHEADFRVVAGGTSLGEARGGVVVSERKRADAARPRAFHERARREHAVGIVAVRMEIDEFFGAGVHRGSV